MQQQQQQQQRRRLRRNLYLMPLTLPLIIGAFLMQLINVPIVKSADSDDNNKEWNMTALDRLRTQLFTNYDKNSHPTSQGVPTNITIGLTVNYIDIDEINGKATIHAWLKARWMDDNRSWSLNDYDNITQIHLRPKEVWKPDITLFNSAGDGGDYVGDTQVLLSNDGSFLWVPPAIYTAYCSLNLARWPYDTQTCKFRIGTWTLTYIDPASLKVGDNLDYNDLVQTTEWELLKARAKYFKKDYYNYVEFTFQMQRRASMYEVIIYVPGWCIIFLTLATFWLPPLMGEKILLNGIIIVVIAAFLMYFAQLLPILADETPLIVLFYSTALLLLSISTVIAVIVLYLATAKHKRRVPDIIKNSLNGNLGKVLLLQHFTLEAEPQSFANATIGATKELNEHVYESPETEATDPLSINPTEEPTNRSIQFDWILLATAVDRLSFLCYLIVFIILAFVYSL